MDRRLRDDLVAAGFDARQATVLACLIPDVSAFARMEDRIRRAGWLAAGGCPAVLVALSGFLAGSGS